MTSQVSAESLKERYAKDELSQEEYFDQIVQGIRIDSHFREFLNCVYEELFDEEDNSSRVSAYNNEELWEAIDLLKNGCTTWENSSIPAYLNLLMDSIGQPDYGLLIRWALSKLVGMSLTMRKNKLTTR